MRGPELSVPMHVYLGTEDEVEIFGVDGSEILHKHFAVCKRTSDALVSNNKNFYSNKRKRRGGGKQLYGGDGTNPLHAV